MALYVIDLCACVCVCDLNETRHNNGIQAEETEFKLLFLLE